MNTVFVTGTDTGAGKTFVSCALLRALRTRGRRACGYKPVAAGCERTPQGLRNSDALALLEASGGDEPYERINPVALEQAIAPHVAAQAAGVKIERQRLNEVHAELAARHELVVVEGAGGWQVPFDERSLFSDWVSERQWPVLLVVGMRLGCINHALLSAGAIQARTSLLGWVANVLPPEMTSLAENIATLKQRISAPLLAVVRGPDDGGALAAALTENLARLPGRKSVAP